MYTVHTFAIYIMKSTFQRHERDLTLDNILVYHSSQKRVQTISLRTMNIEHTERMTTCGYRGIKLKIAKAKKQNTQHKKRTKQQ